MTPFGFYLHYFDIQDPGYRMTGVDKKVMDQINELKRNGIDCRFLHCPMSSSLASKVRATLTGGDDGIAWPSVDELDSPAFIYLRRPRIVSDRFIRFLKELKEKDPDVLVLYEIPTYPYDNEMRGLLRPALRRDRKNRWQLEGLVDRIVDLTGAPTIFDIPTLQIANGLDLGRVHPRMAEGRPSEVKMVCAANFEFWHGVDRVLMGLARYAEKGAERPVSLHLAGGGGALPGLEKLAAELGLQDHVTFYGPLGAEELDQLYDECSLGVECLGIHRRNDADYVTTSLKSKEYLAKGLPFIYSGTLDVIQPGLERFVHQVPFDDAPIDIERVVAFHDGLYEQGQRTVIQELRAFAEEHVSMAVAFKEVVDALEAHLSAAAAPSGNVDGKEAP